MVFEVDYVLDLFAFFEHRPPDHARVFPEERVEAFERLWGRVKVHEPVTVRAQCSQSSRKHLMSGVRGWHERHLKFADEIWGKREKTRELTLRN